MSSRSMRANFNARFTHKFIDIYTWVMLGILREHANFSWVSIIVYNSLAIVDEKSLILEWDYLPFSYGTIVWWSEDAIGVNDLGFAPGVSNTCSSVLVLREFNVFTLSAITWVSNVFTWFNFIIVIK